MITVYNNRVAQQLFKRKFPFLHQKKYGQKIYCSFDINNVKELQEAALSGERVNLHFVKRYMAFPWRGDTKYFATSVERSPSKSNE